MSDVLLLQGVYYGGYVVAGFLGIIFFRKLFSLRLLGLIFRGALLGLFVRARFIEPQRLVIQETRIDVGFEKNIVLIADLHLGVYKDESYLQKIVTKINAIDDVDAVLIAGDFTYEPVDDSAQGLIELFAPLSQVKYPVISVLGNHDVEVPGEPLRKELITALNTHDVIFLNNDAYRLDGAYVVGLGSHLGGEDDIALLDEYDSEDNIIVLTHNPDTIINYTTDVADVTLVGHTHCGQIRNPWLPALYKRAIPTVGDFDCGVYPDTLTQLFITPGVGEVLLPMRFMNPPTIDVLMLR